MDSSDPFDNSDPWAELPSNPPQRPSLAPPVVHEASAPPSTSSSTTTITTTTASSTTSAHTAPAQSITHAQLIEHTTPSTGAYEDQPPSYEQTVVKDLPQIHDNYDHLRGPPGQRGVDVKTRIPLDSTPASHYQNGASGSGGGPSAPRAASPETRYGAIPQPPASVSSKHLVPPSAPSPHSQGPSGLHGQTALGPDDDSHHFRSVDRLLGPDGQANTRAGSDTSSHYEEEPPSHWSIVGESRVWIGLFYTVVVLLPWAVFCFAWTIVTLIIAGVTMIVPPVGYFFAMATITSWRALARVDLAMSTHLVNAQVRAKHPHTIEKVFVPVPESVSSSPAHSSSSSSINGTATEHRGRIRRSNLWGKGSLHLNAAVKNKHTLKTMSYFMIWKMIFALPIFIVTVAFTGLSIPFMACLLPSLLIVNRAFMNWQFRWAIVWLTEKQQPIILH
ncbi:hypothetical protein BGZ59_005046 [Podila verticillata]|nr:hypothetical protein BGZ59_005046 [Podila verticillata]